MIQLRQIDLADDYTTLLNWWAGHEAPTVPQVLLPTLGMMAEADGQPVAAVWLWMANDRGVSFLTFMVTKPGIPALLASDACTALVECMEKVALSHGYGLMFAIAPCHGGAVKLLRRLGFDAGNTEPHIHLLKTLAQ